MITIPVWLAMLIVIIVFLLGVLVHKLDTPGADDSGW